jgi:hypothetical protein
MRSMDTTARFVGLLAVLAILSAYSAFATPDASDADTTAFEANASVAP